MFWLKYCEVSKYDYSDFSGSYTHNSLYQTNFTSSLIPLRPISHFSTTDIKIEQRVRSKHLKCVPQHSAIKAVEYNRI